MMYQDDEISKQVNQCIDLLQSILGSHVLGIYLYGSAVVGGLQKYSDIDLFVVLEQASTDNEKRLLVNGLLDISGIYMKCSKRPIELTMVVKSDINPWHYPPEFDFQYGEWLREEFENGNINPLPSKEMPDLALLITQVLSASNTLLGEGPEQLLCRVPSEDVMAATKDALPNLMFELDSDTRNVLLTLARIWSRVETGIECSKPAAADWVMNCLPEEYRPVMKHAKAICVGEEQECWDGLQLHIKPCADFMVDQIKNRLNL